MLGAEAELDCQSHTAPFPNSMLPTLSGPEYGRGASQFQPDFPYFGLTRQSLMNGCYYPPQPDIEVCELTFCFGSDSVTCPWLQPAKR